MHFLSKLKYNVGVFSQSDTKYCKQGIRISA